jgi:hypothetical protein
LYSIVMTTCSVPMFYCWIFGRPARGWALLLWWRAFRCQQGSSWMWQLHLFLDYLLLQNLATCCLAHANNSSLLFGYMCSFLLLHFPLCASLILFLCLLIVTVCSSDFAASCLLILLYLCFSEFSIPASS